MNSSMSWMQKQVTWRSCPNAYGFYTHWNAICYQVSTYILMGGWSLCSVDSGRKDQGLIYRSFYTLFMHHPEVDSCSIPTSFWDNLELYQWREIFTLGKTSGSKHDLTFCLEGKWSDGIVHWFTVCRNGLIKWSETWKEFGCRIGEKDIWRNMWIVFSK